MTAEVDSRLIHGDENDGNLLKPQKVSRFRRYLPQVKKSPFKYFRIVLEKYFINFNGTRF